MKHAAKHFFYATGWKKFEPAWDMMIRIRQLKMMTPMLEAVLSKVTSGAGFADAKQVSPAASSTLSNL